MKPFTLLFAPGLTLPAPLNASAQHSVVHRLPSDLLDVVPPSAWVEGAPGAMSVQPRTCRSVRVDALRRRIVDVATQEWIVVREFAADAARCALR